MTWDVRVRARCQECRRTFWTFADWEPEQCAKCRGDEDERKRMRAMTTTTTWTWEEDL